jgi:hypothetical protein
MLISGRNNAAQITELSTSSGQNSNLSDPDSRGTININMAQPGTGSLTISERGRVNASTASNNSSYTGGSINLSVVDLSLTNGGQLLTTSTDAAAAGEIAVNASHSILISGSKAALISEFNNPILIDSIGDVSINVDSSNNLESILLSSGFGALDVSPFLTGFGIGSLSALSAETPTQGSAVKITPVGGDLDFNWDFSSFDYVPFDDFAFTQLNSGAPSKLASVSDTSGSSGTLTATSGSDNFFGIVDVRDSAVDSFLRLQPTTTVEVIAPQDSVDVNSPFVSGLFAQAEGTGNAGSVTVNAPSITINGGQISAETKSGGATSEANVTVGSAGGLQTLSIQNGGKLSVSTATGVAGDVVVTATAGTNPAVNLNNGTIEAAATGTGGQAGSVTITTPDLDAQNNSLIAASNQGDAAGSNSFVKLAGISILNVANSLITTSTESGAAGSIEINDNKATQITLSGLATTLDLDGSGVVDADEILGGIVAQATAGGNAGQVDVDTQVLTIQDGAAIAVSSTGSGTAGDVNITASNATLNNGSITAETEAGGTDTSKSNVTLQGLDLLSLQNGSEISVSTNTGVAGNVTVNDTNDLVNELLIQNSQIAAQATSGNAGDVTLNASSVIVQAGLVTSATQSGNAGSVTVNAAGGAVNLSGTFTNPVDSGQQAAGLLAEAEAGGNAGSVTVTTNQLNVNAGAAIAVSSLNGAGTAGDIKVSANSATLDNGAITAETDAGGTEAAKSNVTLQGLNTLTLQNSSNISASTATGIAGDVGINQNTAAAQSVNLSGNRTIV